MSETPRTDAEMEYDASNIDDVKAFARQLERENAALRADKERLLKRIKASQKVLDPNWNGLAGESIKQCVQRNYAAIDAARKEQP